MSRISFTDRILAKARLFFVLGERELLTPNNGKLMKALPPSTHLYLKAIRNKKASHISTICTDDKTGEKIKFDFCEISSERSRNTGLLRVDSIQSTLSKAKIKDECVQIIFALHDIEQVLSAGIAVSKSFPLYDRRTNERVNSDISVSFSLKDDTEVSKELLNELKILSDATRTCAKYNDTPCADLNTTKYISEVKEQMQGLKNVKIKIISGEDLIKEKLLGIWNTGKGATNPPALIVLEYDPGNNISTENVVALIGKGIVYDSGGLSLKPANSMAGMKADMSGSSACLCVFKAAVQLEYPGKLFALLCLAENAIGPTAQRVDDIYTAHSGLSVEVTNTDAEGRLVLGDGMSYATTFIKPTHIIDIATLTGAQLYVTGSKHAAVMSPTEKFEKLILSASAKSGEWAFPMIYAPEILNPSYNSPVADMRNTLNDKNCGAHSSCAGNFIEKHKHKDWKGEWAHLDIAYPAKCDGRSTGFGVTLLYQALLKIAADKKYSQH